MMNSERPADGTPSKLGGVAVLTMELQRGVVGDLASMPDLRDGVEEVGLLASVRKLLAGARTVGIPVIHATVTWREDRRGTPLNTPLTRHLAANPDQVLEHSPSAELDGAIGADLSVDLVSNRHHGLTPFTGTTLDALVRSLGVSQLVICGVSLNVGILGAVVEAVGLGYEVMVPIDAVVGVPVVYGESVIRNSLRPLASLATTDEIVRSWR